MSKEKNSIYDENSIMHMSPLEHIRLRPGMYIGRLGDGSHIDDGIYVLLKEVIDNSIDEYVMGFGKNIIVQINDNKVQVRDFGRGIPLGKVIDCVSEINTGAKYTDNVFRYSVGLNGVGTKAVNALSSSFHVISYRDKQFSEAFFEKGKLISKNQGETKEKNGVFIEFIPDVEAFGTYQYKEDLILQRIENYCYLNSGLCITYNGKQYQSAGGLLDLLEGKINSTKLYEPVHYVGKTLEFCFSHTNVHESDTFYSYVNGQYTSDGGTHLSAFKEGLTKAFNQYFKKQWNSIDIREDIIGAVSVKVNNPVFESQTKNKLGNTDIRSEIVNETVLAINEFLIKNTSVASVIKQKISENENLRKKLAEVKKTESENSKKVSISIKKLKDCKYHLGSPKNSIEEGEESMIFLTEGNSASGTLTQVRNVLTQAVFSMRGKPKNTEGKDEDYALNNEELYMITAALGLGNGIAGLRYGKIVIASDADVDGYHIRNLLITFFLSYYPELFNLGRIYYLDTPLFRVRNNKQTLYCYTENDKTEALKTIRNPEITRFKGLGELSSQDFKDFIGKDMRLIQITLDNMEESIKAMHFYGGKNTPQRRDFIMENLL